MIPLHSSGLVRDKQDSPAAGVKLEAGGGAEKFAGGAAEPAAVKGSLEDVNKAIMNYVSSINNPVQMHCIAHHSSCWQKDFLEVAEGHRLGQRGPVCIVNKDIINSIQINMRLSCRL